MRTMIAAGFALALVATARAQCPTPNPDVPVGTSRTNPAALGVGFETTFVDEQARSFKGTITPLQILRGQEAYDLFLLSDRFAPEPLPGTEYLFAWIRIEVTCAPTADTPLYFQWTWLTALSSEWAEYDKLPACCDDYPNPDLNVRIYPGGAAEGWAFFLVRTDDPCPLLTFGREPSGAGGLWWKLLETTPAQVTAFRNSLSLPGLFIAFALSALLVRRRRPLV